MTVAPSIADDDLRSAARAGNTRAMRVANLAGATMYHRALCAAAISGHVECMQLVHGWGDGSDRPYRYDRPLSVFIGVVLAATIESVTNPVVVLLDALILIWAAHFNRSRRERLLAILACLAVAARALRLPIPSIATDFRFGIALFTGIAIVALVMCALLPGIYVNLNDTFECIEAGISSATFVGIVTLATRRVGMHPLLEFVIVILVAIRLAVSFELHVVKAIRALSGERIKVDDSVLRHAAAGGNLDCIALAVALGARGYDRALVDATDNGHSAAMAWLEERGVTPPAVRQAFIQAARRGRIECMELALGWGARAYRSAQLAANYSGDANIIEAVRAYIAGKA